MLNMAQVIGLIKKFGSGGSSSSGGSSVQPDWNQNDPAAADYVKNRTHWSEDGKVILPETVLTYNSDEDCHQIITPLEATAKGGVVYTVTVDGVEYECKGISANEITEGAVRLKNTERYFEILLHSKPIDEGDYVWYGYVDWVGNKTEPMTVSIAEKETVKKLDGKYLPPDITIPSGGSLTIKEGATVNDEAGVLGGSGGAMRVNVTIEDETTYVADKTYEEIAEAIASGVMPYCVFSGMVFHLSRSYSLAETAAYAAPPSIDFAGLLIQGTANSFAASLSVEEGGNKVNISMYMLSLTAIET